jgi:hypothetical protein
MIDRINSCFLFIPRKSNAIEHKIHIHSIHYRENVCTASIQFLEVSAWLIDCYNLKRTVHFTVTRSNRLRQQQAEFFLQPSVDVYLRFCVALIDVLPTMKCEVQSKKLIHDR